MSLKSSANRYARALFDVVLKEGDLSQIERDLSAVVDLFGQHGEALQPVFRHGVPDSARRGVIKALVEGLGLGPHVQKLLGMLADRGRLDLLPLLAEAYRERLLTHQNIVRAQVTSAAPLSAENAKALEASLGRVTGKKVELSMSVDQELIGGVVARIGSTVYDGSVRTQLDRIRRTLVK